MDGIPLFPFLIGLLAFSQVLVQVVKAFKEKGSSIAYCILYRRDLGDNLTLNRGTVNATERVYYQYKQLKKLVLQ